MRGGANPMTTTPRKQELDPELVSDISEQVYRRRLNDDSGQGADERMIAKDGDGGKKLRGRARAYDPLTRAYLRVLGGASTDAEPTNAMASDEPVAQALFDKLTELGVINAEVRDPLRECREVVRALRLTSGERTQTSA